MLDRFVFWPSFSICPAKSIVSSLILQSKIINWLSRATDEKGHLKGDHPCVKTHRKSSTELQRQLPVNPSKFARLSVSRKIAFCDARCVTESIK